MYQTFWVGNVAMVRRQQLIFDYSDLSMKLIVYLSALWSGGQIGEEDNNLLKYLTVVQNLRLDWRRMGL